MCESLETMSKVTDVLKHVSEHVNITKMLLPKMFQVSFDDDGTKFQQC